MVVTSISRFKKNDYAFTKAVTLGEQIESTDFENQTSFHDDFIERWIKRALSEEFGIDEKQYHTITGKMQSMYWLLILRVIFIIFHLW